LKLLRWHNLKVMEPSEDQDSVDAPLDGAKVGRCGELKMLLEEGQLLALLVSKVAQRLRQRTQEQHSALLQLLSLDCARNLADE